MHIFLGPAAKTVAPENYGQPWLSYKMLFPLLRFPLPTPLPLTFSHARAHATYVLIHMHTCTHIHMHAREYKHICIYTSSTTPRASPLDSLPLPSPQAAAVLWMAESGGVLLAAHAINSKACRFYWMDLARPPYPSSLQPLPLYWLLRRGWVGVRHAGCRSIDRPSCITVHS